MVLTTIVNRGWVLSVHGLSPVSNAWLTTVAVLVPTVLAPVVTYFGVEQSFLRLRVRYLVPDSPAAAPQSPALPPNLATTSELASLQRLG